MPSTDQLSGLEALIAETGARILNWEAELAAEAIEAVAALGVESVVFETPARGAASGAFIETLTANVTALANATMP